MGRQAEKEFLEFEKSQQVKQFNKSMDVLQGHCFDDIMYPSTMTVAQLLLSPELVICPLTDFI